MQLEKAHSSEAGLAGWISSNDVTLFTMVLVVVIALFLHSKLIKGTSENEQLTREKAELTALKQEVESDLDSTREELSQAEATLERAREEQQALDTQLAQRKQMLQETEEALQNAQQRSGKLKVELDEALALVARLETDKTGLQTDKANLQNTKTELESEQARLLAAKAVLETDKDKLSRLRDSLAKEKISLSDKLAALAVQLDDKVKALKDAEAQRDRLKEQADNLDVIVATLQQKLNLATADMEKVKSESDVRIGELEQTAKASTARAEDYLARLRRAAELFKGMEADKQQLKSQVSNLSDRYQQQLARETTISRELVGIKGSLRRVAFLFDASGSMKQRDGAEGDRWLEAQKIAGKWLAHLEVDECLLVIFATRVYIFPTDGSLLRVSGEEGEANRKQLLDTLNRVEPKGVTNTLDALRTAYRYEGIDTIVLFSDGAPTGSASGQFDPYIAQQIYELCRQHPDVPVNTIGLGNYFDKDMSTFLRNVAQITGGTFRGR